jgi:hypothetical protein
MASSSDILAIIGFVLALIVASYDAYWAFNISRALAVRLYRNQALGIGLIAVGAVAAQLGVTAYYLGLIPQALQIPGPLFVTLTLFFWTDASMRAGRRSDPLLRDTLHWSRVRMILLGFLILDLAVLAIFFAIPQFAGANFLLLVINLPVFVPVITAAVALPIASRRSKDTVLHRNLIWFGFFALFLLAFVLLPSNFLPNPLQALLVTDVGGIVAFYCLYRSARSLVPLNKLSLDDSK